MVVQNWADAVVGSFKELWLSFAGFLPEIIGAIVVLAFGLIVAAGLGMLVEKVFDALRLTPLINKTGVGEYFKRGGVEFNIARFFGRLTYWFVTIVAVTSAAEVLGLKVLSQFLYQGVLLYIPRVAGAVLILLAAIVVANFLKSIVRASVMSAKMHSAKFLGALTWWAVVVLGLFAALSTLGIDTDAIKIVLWGLMMMIALAGGIAFGLGGKDYAAHLVNRLREDVHEK